MRIRIHWTQSSIEHIGRHRVSRLEVEQALWGSLYIRRRRERIQLLGRTGDRCLAIVIEPSSQNPDEFEVVTARDATAAEKRLLGRRGRG